MKKKNHFGKYYAVWILCDSPYPMLPNNPGKNPRSLFTLGIHESYQSI